MFDNSGKIKQADKLLLELNAKFMKLGKNDKTLMRLKNQFTGSDGLISFINAATDSSGQLQQTFSSFDASEFGLNKALAIAKEDINYINDQLKNKLNVTMIKLGEKLLPLKQSFAETAMDAVNGINLGFTGPEGRANYRREVGRQEILDMFSGFLNDPAKHTTKEFNDAFSKIDKLMPYYQSELEKNREYAGGITRFLDNFGLSGSNAQKRYNYSTSEGSYQALKQLRNQLLSVFVKLPKNHDSLLASGDKTAPDGSGTTTPVGSDSVEKITGSAKQIRNLTINIDSFVKGGINTQSTTLQQMDEKQIEAYLRDMFMRVIANVDNQYQ